METIEYGVSIEAATASSQAISAAVLAPNLALNENQTTSLEADYLQAQLGFRSEMP